VPEKGKAKALIEAYEIASHGHDLDHFKEVLAAHADYLAEEERIKEEKAAEKAAAKAAKTDRKKRKSEAKVEAEDVEMEDANDAGEAKKSSKKRKNVAESDDEEPEKVSRFEDGVREFVILLTSPRRLPNPPN
jgi:type IV secretory pathway VirB10-like protein